MERGERVMWRRVDRDLECVVEPEWAKASCCWFVGSDILPIGELSDSKARIVITWALMMESAIMLSEVFLLWRPLDVELCCGAFSRCCS